MCTKRKIRNILLVTFVFLIIGTTVFTSILDSKIDRNLKEYSNSNTGSVTDLCLQFIKINNIVPSIAKNLNSELTLNVGDKKTISFSANETNNVYTWYFSKMEKVKW